MERITPPIYYPTYMLRRGTLTKQQTVSELGIYSSVIIDISNTELLENRVIGRLLRTKGVQSDEGGINTGYSVIDQPYLVEWDPRDSELKGGFTIE
jgi:glutathione synthase